MFSIHLWSLGQDLSSLKSVKLLLVEVGKPMVVHLSRVSKEGCTSGVADAVAREGCHSNNTPLGSAKLGVPQIGQ